MDFLFFLNAFLMFFTGKIAFRTGFQDSLVEKEDRTHNEITKCALYRITFTYLENKYGKLEDLAPVSDNGRCDDAKMIIKKTCKNLNLKFKFLKNTINNIARINRFTDIEEMSKEEAHFDSEQFDESAKRLLIFKTAAVYAIKNGDFDKARSFYGRLLHTAQDFYSHSNWVEFNPESPNNELVRSLILGEVVDDNTPACLECNSETECKNNINPILIKNKLLTSGYFSLTSDQKPIGKCSHGGDLDMTAKSGYDGINKDKVSSPHGYLHYKAANLAEAATYRIFNDLWLEIGNSYFHEFLGFSGITIAIIFENDNELNSKIETTRNIIKQYESSDTNYIHNFIFSTSNGLFIKASSALDFMKQLEENRNKFKKTVPFFERITTAFASSEPNSIFYLHTSITNIDVNNKILPLAEEKNIIVNVIFDVSNYFTLSILDTEFDRLTQQTSGIAIYLSEIKDLPYFINDKTNLDSVQTLLIGEVYNSKEISYEQWFFCDDTIEKIYVTISSNSISVFIMDPLNEVTKLIGDNKTGLTDEFIFEKLVTGRWTIFAQGSSFNFKISAISAFSIKSTLFLNDSNYGLIELLEPPIIGQSLIILTTQSEFSLKLTEVSIQIVSKSLKMISAHQPFKISEKFYLTSFVVPSEEFRIKFHGIDDNSELFERYETELFKPSIVNVNILKNFQSASIEPGKEFKLKYKIIYKHRRKAINIKVIIEDTLKLISFQEIVKVRKNNEFSKSLTFFIPENAIDLAGEVDTIIITIFDVDVDLTEALNYETTYVTILPKDFIPTLERTNDWISKIISFFKNYIAIIVVSIILVPAFILVCNCIKDKKRQPKYNELKRKLLS